MNIPTLLDPSNCTLLLVDYQPQMIFGVKSIDGQTLVNNVEGLAKAAKAFGVPTVLSSIAEKSFSGPTVSQLRNVFPEKADHRSYVDERLGRRARRRRRREDRAQEAGPGGALDRGSA